MITLTSETFDDQVVNSTKPVLVDFWADWCPPCAMLPPILEQIERERGDRLAVATINGDDHPDIVARYGVMAFPTLLLFRDGELSHRLVGARPKRKLLAELDGAL
ncbi:thioredoxin [Spiractinospora alimapuensis]|nr:thioredoxin [Spiractinospora alimapuensis]